MATVSSAIDVLLRNLAMLQSNIAIQSTKIVRLLDAIGVAQSNLIFLGVMPMFAIAAFIKAEQ